MKFSRFFLSAVMSFTAVFSTFSYANLLDLGVSLNSLDTYTFAVGQSDHHGVPVPGSLILGSEATIYGNIAVEGHLALATGASVLGDTCAVSYAIAASASIAGNQESCIVSSIRDDILAAQLAAQNLVGTELFDITASTTLSTQTSNVFWLDDLLLDSHEVLTIEGSATDAMVINVRGDASLDSLAGIQLSGGIHGRNVLFNFLDVVGTANFEFGGADISGTFLANKRSFQMGDGALLNNTRFFTNASMQANVQVVHNPPHVAVPEPETLILIFAGLVLLLLRSNSKHQ